MEDRVDGLAFGVMGGIVAVVAALIALASVSVALIVVVSGGTSSSVAATVNGAPIEEARITQYVQGFRSHQGLEDDDDWKGWLKDCGYTPAIVREQAIGYFASQEIVRQAAVELGVVVEEGDVDEALADVKSSYSSEEAWEADMGAQRSIVEFSMLQDALVGVVAGEEGVDDDELLAYVQASGYGFNGSKRSSHVLFAKSDRTKAVEVLDAIVEGDLSFEDAARYYSQDSSTSDNGGDVGWDASVSLPLQYQVVLDGLAVGEVSDLVESDQGIHIIKCTGEAHVAQVVSSLSDASPELVEYLRDTLGVRKRQDAYAAWLQELIDSADIVVSDMPAGLPYDAI